MRHTGHHQMAGKRGERAVARLAVWSTTGPAAGSLNVRGARVGHGVRGDTGTSSLSVALTRNLLHAACVWLRQEAQSAATWPRPTAHRPFPPVLATCCVSVAVVADPVVEHQAGGR